MGGVQASGGSERCPQGLHSQMPPSVPAALGTKGLGVPVLPPSKQIGADLSSELGHLGCCSTRMALGCLGLLWGAGETSLSPVGSVGGEDQPQANPTASVAENTGGISTSF